MLKICLASCLLIFINFVAPAQTTASRDRAGKLWADSVFKTLSQDEQIAQLMVVRLSAYDFKNKVAIFYDEKVDSLVKQYNIGGICLFQGSPVKQAEILNRLQSHAKTPILMCIDAEWGVGMRMIDSVLPLPHQMMLGAVSDVSIPYRYGQVVAEQCKRIGIQVNYAPVVDINNNPNNPVINDRSFGEDKYKVALFGTQYMRGMQDLGVMACAKHFPGHGDVAVDSHHDLPVINKTMAQLDSLELYPFRQLFKAGIGSAMIAHLYIPAIDKSENRATSISKNNVTGLMRDQLGYQGLTFTDALEMQGVQKYFPNGAASVESLIAGNDMLCLPGDVPLAIQEIKAAIADNRLSWQQIEQHCRKVLQAKYQYGLTALKPINTVNLTADLNSEVPAMRRLIAEHALTVLHKGTDGEFLLPAAKTTAANEVVYVGIGISADNGLATRLKADYNADVFFFDYKQDSLRVAPTLELIRQRYKKVIVGVHGYNRTPANNFGLSKNAIDLVNQLQEQPNATVLVFGNPYAIKNFCSAKNLVACYEDNSIIHNTAVDLLQGKIAAKGRLPVTVCEVFPFGSGMVSTALSQDPETKRQAVAFSRIDSIATDAIEKGATPGCVVLVVKDGSILFNKAYGQYSFGGAEQVNLESVYDMASVTKICATTISVMKLYEQGKLDLKKTLGEYLPWVKGTNKASLQIEDILLHQAGLVPYIPFYKEAIDSNGKPYTKYFATQPSDSFKVRVAENLYLRNDWNDTMYRRILQSPLSANNKYVYSDNDFIFLGKIVEAITGLSLNEYVRKEFYVPLGLSAAGFKPRERLPIGRIVPTEREPLFRLQLVRGDVHDPGAAMFGGVAGHAGLFSTAYDIAIVMQLLLNEGKFNGKQYLRKETIDLFTAYHSKISRRGLGFDKPEKDNATRPEAYPTFSASPKSFGHTGFTGTCTWADPESNLVYVFLSNRVSPKGDNPLLGKMNVRPAIHEAIYEAIGKTKVK
ncbi:MAG: glycoside hydrolase family 3 N-terminal domain-containing protein [Ferruginibacter sp.]|nr:glycoside hydrolase family 3 N-terminal domain-containing protein [Ferruginibacter sp.]